VVNNPNPIQSESTPGKKGPKKTRLCDRENMFSRAVSALYTADTDDASGVIYPCQPCKFRGCHAK
jgi:hypothetical protein